MTTNQVALHEHKFIIVLCWRSEVWNGSDCPKIKYVGRAAFLAGGSEGESVSLLFPASRVCPHSLAQGPPPSSKPVITSWVLLTSPHYDFPVSLFHLLKRLWLHWAHPENSRDCPHEMISNADSKCNTKISLPCNITQSQVLGIRTWTYFGGHNSAYHKGLNSSATANENKKG